MKYMRSLFQQFPGLRLAALITILSNLTYYVSFKPAVVTTAVVAATALPGCAVLFSGFRTTCTGKNGYADDSLCDKGERCRYWKDGSGTAYHKCFSDVDWADFMGEAKAANGVANKLPGGVDANRDQEDAVSAAQAPSPRAPQWQNAGPKGKPTFEIEAGCYMKGGCGANVGIKVPLTSK